MCALEGTHRHAAAEPCRRFPAGLSPGHSAPQLACVQERCGTNADSMEIFVWGVRETAVLLPRICPAAAAGDTRWGRAGPPSATRPEVPARPARRPARQPPPPPAPEPTAASAW